MRNVIRMLKAWWLKSKRANYLIKAACDRAAEREERWYGDPFADP
jgi:hypothetical protein